MKLNGERRERDYQKTKRFPEACNLLVEWKWDVVLCDRLSKIQNAIANAITQLCFGSVLLYFTVC